MKVMLIAQSGETFEHEIYESSKYLIYPCFAKPKIEKTETSYIMH